jgi:hypothetical protein
VEREYCEDSEGKGGNRTGAKVNTNTRAIRYNYSTFCTFFLSPSILAGYSIIAITALAAIYRPLIGIR